MPSHARRQDSTRPASSKQRAAAAGAGGRCLSSFIAGPAGGKALVGFQPFLFEGFLREIGKPTVDRVLPPPLDGPPDMARLLPIAAKNGMEILGPPGPPPGR